MGKMRDRIAFLERRLALMKRVNARHCSRDVQLDQLRAALDERNEAIRQLLGADDVIGMVEADVIRWLESRGKAVVERQAA